MHANLLKEASTVNHILWEAKQIVPKRQWMYLLQNVYIIICGGWDSHGMNIRIRNALPFWSLRTNKIYGLIFMKIRVQGINVIRFVYSRMTCPSKFIYCLEDNKHKYAEQIDYSSEVGVENKSITTVLWFYSPQWQKLILYAQKIERSYILYD